MGKIFIKTEAEFKNYLPIYNSAKIDNIKAYIEEAAIKWVKPLLGDYYTTLLDGYDEATYAVGTDEEGELLSRLQRAVANLTYYLAIPALNVQMKGSGGFTIDQSGTSVPASQWRVDDLRRQVFESGMDALDDMLEYLEAQKAHFTVWAADDIYSELNKHFITTAKEFNKHVYIKSSRATFVAMEPVMKQVEEFDVRPLLGDDYYDALKAKVLADTTTEEDDRIITWLLPGIAQLTLAKGLDQLSLDISQAGVLINTRSAIQDNARESSQAKLEQMLGIKRRAEEAGNTWLKKVKTYLDANASASAYATYFGSDAYTEPDDEETSTYSEDSDRKIHLM